MDRFKIHPSYSSWRFGDGVCLFTRKGAGRESTRRSLLLEATIILGARCAQFGSWEVSALSERKKQQQQVASFFVAPATGAKRGDCCFFFGTVLTLLVRRNARVGSLGVQETVV